MRTERDKPTSEVHLPYGFFTIRLDQLLLMLAMAIAFVWSVFLYSAFVSHVLVIAIAVLMVSSVVVRRGMRRFVRRHGPIKIETTYSPVDGAPGKRVWFREAGQVIDDVIDSAIDGCRKT